MLLVALGFALFITAMVLGQKSTTVRGHAINYSLQLPSSWGAKPGSGRNSGYDIVASSGDVYVGVVAENATWGTPETVAASGLKRQKNVMPDAQCSDPKPIIVDGRQWLQFMSTGHNESVAISLLAYVYSGPEGTFQMCGWTTQNAFDRALPSIRRVMESFRFPEISRAAVAPPLGAGSASPSAPASSLVHGNDLDYTLRFPSDWMINKSEPYDILANSKSLYVGIVAEKANLGSSAFVQKMAEKNVADVGATDVQVTESERIAIDGREWIGFVLRCTSSEKAPLAHQFYVYTGPEGTFQLIAWTTQNLFERDVSRARSIMQSFVFPAGSSPTAPGHSSDTSTWKVLSARELACSIRIPDDWQEKPVSGDFAIIVSRDAIRIGVIAEEGNLGSPETIATIARKKLAEAATAYEVTEPRSLQIDGRRWLQFVAKCDVDKAPMTYQFYVYAGPEGSYQIIGWTIQDLFDPNSSEIRQVMQTFKFPR